MKKEVIVWTEKQLTKEQRKNYAKEHPGERLSFMLRFPNTPLWMSILSSVIGTFTLAFILLK